MTIRLKKENIMLKSFIEEIIDEMTPIAQKTKNEVIMDKNNNLIEISLVDNDEYRWQKAIKKSKILEFALKHKINLSNISDIKPVYENEKVKGLEIGGKLFDYQMLITEFGLESNTIEKIETTKTEVIIQGKNKGLFDNFSTYKSEQLSNDNHNYKDILKVFFNDFKISWISSEKDFFTPLLAFSFFCLLNLSGDALNLPKQISFKACTDNCLA